MSHVKRPLSHCKPQRPADPPGDVGGRRLRPSNTGEGVTPPPVDPDRTSGATEAPRNE
ncbi:MAG TPA: hypothetical protein VD907_00855 [Verrucomicrobiae bacterium]|nr:hypothetical protein [Verrucomicrobiae bacterium]